MTERGKRIARVELYKNRKGEWSWRIRAKNGAVICTPGEGFNSKRNAKAAFWRVEKLIVGGAYEFVQAAK
jgi:uncharacterized protein YegP (UPF0339 family)